MGGHKANHCFSPDRESFICDVLIAQISDNPPLFPIAGEYFQQGNFNGKPLYKRKNKKIFLWWNPDWGSGSWFITQKLVIDVDTPWYYEGGGTFVGFTYLGYGGGVVTYSKNPIY